MMNSKQINHHSNQNQSSAHQNTIQAHQNNGSSKQQQLTACIQNGNLQNNQLQFQKQNGHAIHNPQQQMNGSLNPKINLIDNQEFSHIKQVPPIQTFELQNFDNLHEQFDNVQHQVKPKIELTQAHMMTTNFKEAAAIVTAGQPCAPKQSPSGLSQPQVSSGHGHTHKHDYVNSLVHTCLSSDMHQLSRLLLNLGPQDKSSNFLLEQRSLNRAQAQENRPIREFQNQQVVGDEEWVRAQEQIAKARAEAGFTQKPDQFSSLMSNETQDDSGQNAANLDQNKSTYSSLKDQLNSQHKIANIITKIRQYGQKYLAPIDGQEYLNDQVQAKAFTFNVKQLQKKMQSRKLKQKQVAQHQSQDYLKQLQQINESLYNKFPVGKVPISTICKKLRSNSQFMEHQSKVSKQSILKKREIKSNSKMSNGAIINDVYIQDTNQEKNDLKNKINQIETVMDLEKRFKQDDESNAQSNVQNSTVLTSTELDIKSTQIKTLEVQKVLFDFCELNHNNFDDFTENQNTCFSNLKVDKILGKIRKLPNNSNLLQNYTDQLLDLNDEDQDDDDFIEDNQKSETKSRMIKQIGLQPEQLFQKVQKYRVDVNKLPTFSCEFDQIDCLHPSLSSNAPLAMNQMANALTSPLNYQRIDGRPVISLNFNPFNRSFLNGSAETVQEQMYQSQMQEILKSRAQLKSAPKEAKLKQEVQNLKRAWQLIVKKDIPKAYRMYQKYKADQENNTKKLSQNCLKEVRKRAVRTQRLAKESVTRARKLTKDMVLFWRRRDREIADSKRKREKIDKELKKRQQEEEEALLQKKRLEYLMQQSEIYAHFMAVKIGKYDEQKKGQLDIDNDGFKKDKRLDIDQKAARKQIAGIINENRKRLDEYDNRERVEVDEDDLQEHKFNEPKQLTVSVEAPKIFKGDLKAYQLKGLQWLDNLYEQGINGILADEMGLGKTIQAISLMAHLAEKKNVWGPFLVVVPVTTLHNWQNELSKFCPDLKVLPYFGSAEERKKLAKFLDPKNLYNPAMRIHVLITSYNIVVGGNSINKDQMRLQRVKWHYMILDEAQAIKNNQSRRWKTLLNFQTRNRLLLSGTPIQNSMAELWALLHFIMPKLFDNHEQFQEWFSKDIEQHSMDQGELNKHQLKRLHLILQPFMLRRLKKDVEQEIAPKIEETISCEMTHRQKVLYDRIKRKISMQDLFQQVKTKAKMENLMNLVMQFRKVCNHPDLFERRLGKIPFVFSKMNHGMVYNYGMASKPEVVKTTSTPITYNCSKLIFDECFLINTNNTSLFTKLVKGRDIALSTISVDTHFALFNIFNEQYLHDRIFNNSSKQFTENNLSILGLLARSNNWSMSTIAYLAVAQSSTNCGDIIQNVALLHYYSQKAALNQYLKVHNNDQEVYYSKQIGFTQYNGAIDTNYYRVDAIVSDFVSRNDWSILYRDSMEENLDLSIQGSWVLRKALIPEKPQLWFGWSTKIKSMVTQIYFANVICDPIDFHCESTSAKRWVATVINNPMAKKVLIGKHFKPAKDYDLGKVTREYAGILSEDNPKCCKLSISNNFDKGPPTGYQLIDEGILNSNFQIHGSTTFQLPDYSRMITDCSKMAVLNDLLQRLHRDGHRCLIFCQMTKMMDILEDFLIWQKFSYFRMDGSTLLQDRRFMVEEYQTNPNIFAFILSTRAGGLGINLIAADTVIFYDNDWNPTMDSQATDRAHRIGQRKTVHVYRLVTSNTVEERILLRARQKESVQSTVYGANLKADAFSARDAVEMIYDDIAPVNPASTSGRNPVDGTVKGFIKGSSKANAAQTISGASSKLKQLKSKKKGKGADDQDEAHDQHGRKRRLPRREEWSKFDKEWEQFVGEQDIHDKNTNQKEAIDVDDVEQQESGSDQELSQESDIDMRDTKNCLLKILERKGAAKQVFNFQEDEGQEIGQWQQNYQKQEGQVKQTKLGQKPTKGRPNMQINGNKINNPDEDDIDYGDEDEDPQN